MEPKVVGLIGAFDRRVKTRTRLVNMKFPTTTEGRHAQWRALLHWMPCSVVISNITRKSQTASAKPLRPASIDLCVGCARVCESNISQKSKELPFRKQSH